MGDAGNAVVGNVIEIMLKTINVEKRQRQMEECSQKPSYSVSVTYGGIMRPMAASISNLVAIKLN